MKIWIIGTVIVILIAAGAYVYAQYWFAQKPALGGIPEYPSGEYGLKGSPFPIDHLTSHERADSEASLRELASNVEPGYRIIDARFLATRGGFTWDAIRSAVGGYLSDASFRVEAAGQTPEKDTDIAYLVWRRSNRLQRMFNDNIIVAAALQDPIRPAPLDDQVHVYAYFDLTR